MKAIGLTVISASCFLATYAQDFQVPKNYTLQSAEDFDQHESDVVNCVTWLTNTPLKTQTQKRKEANAFLLQWISGSSKVHIELKQEIVSFMDNGDLLMIFMGAWTKYSIESGDFNNKINGITAGLDAVMNFYTKNKGDIPRNKAVEKYIKMKENGTLKEYIEKNA